MLQLYDTMTGTTLNTTGAGEPFSVALASGTRAVVAPGIVTLETKGKFNLDLNGDGDFEDTQLRFFEVGTQTLVTTDVTLVQGSGIPTSVRADVATDGQVIVYTLSPYPFAGSGTTEIRLIRLPGAVAGAAADLAVSKSGSLGANNTITYTMTVTNNGPGSATGVTLTDVLPSTLSFVSINPSSGSCFNNNGTVTCSFGTLTNGATRTVTLVTSASGGGAINNTATVTANESDPNTTNNASTAVVTIPVPMADQTIAFAPLAGKTFGDPPFTVGATASSGLPVSFAASANCSISGNTVTIAGAGSCTITASQAGNARYNPAPSVSQTFAIAKANQSITFGPLDNKSFGDPPFTVGAIASSGLPASASSPAPRRSTGIPSRSRSWERSPCVRRRAATRTSTRRRPTSTGPSP